MNYLIKLHDNTDKMLGMHDVTIFADGEKVMVHGFTNKEKANGFVSGYVLALKHLGKDVSLDTK